jgi:predicted DNA-binding WGR domain protein
MDSKSKRVRANAEAVLARWNEMEAAGLLPRDSAEGGAEEGGSFDLIAYAAKNMPSSVKKLLAFTDPVSWPGISFAEGRDKSGVPLKNTAQAAPLTTPSTPAASASPVPNRWSRGFVYQDAKSHKFWTITVEGAGFTVSFGKAGTQGQKSVKEFADEGACKKAADKLIAEKTGKGYVEDPSQAASGGLVTPAAQPLPAPIPMPEDVPGKTVPLDVLRCYMALYLESKEMKRLFGAEKIRALLDPKDMALLVRRVYEEWLGAGGDAKTKGMMTLYAIHGGDEAVRGLKGKVKDFDYASRSAMAGDAVRAIAVSDLPRRW